MRQHRCGIVAAVWTVLWFCTFSVHWKKGHITMFGESNWIAGRSSPAHGLKPHEAPKGGGVPLSAIVSVRGAA